MTMQIRSGCEGGGKGALIQENKSATLSTHNTQTLFAPIVTHSVDQRNFTIGKEVGETLHGTGHGSSVATIMQPIPIADKATRYKGGGDTRNNDGSANGLGIGEPGAPANTLTAADRHAVAYAIDRAAFNQGANAQYGISIQEEVAQTLVAKGPGAVAQPEAQTYAMQGFGDYKESDKASSLKRRDFKDNTDLVVDEIEYIVRRLTPLECCRLQGFPDNWAEELGIPEPTQEEINHWRQVFRTHMEAMGEDKKEKTDNQIRKWLKDPESDSAKYKMWGNGIALPCAMFVMEGIALALEEESNEE